TGKCMLYLVPQGFYGNTGLSLAFPKNSSLTSKVNVIIRRLKESGILDHLLRKAFINITECLLPNTYVCEIQRAAPSG
ncbi:hypothetical protein SK128_025659, partial [Halocaridina rubra]